MLLLSTCAVRCRAAPRAGSTHRVHLLRRRRAGRLQHHCHPHPEIVSRPGMQGNSAMPQNALLRHGPSSSAIVFALFFNPSICSAAVFSGSNIGVKRSPLRSAVPLLLDLSFSHSFIQAHSDNFTLHTPTRHSALFTPAGFRRRGTHARL